MRVLKRKRAKLFKKGRRETIIAEGVLWGVLLIVVGDKVYSSPRLVIIIQCKRLRIL